MADSSIKNKSFMRSLCMGQLEEDILFPYPRMKKEEAEVCKQLADSIESWLGPKADEFRKWDHEGEMPKEFLEEMKQFGVFGLIVPEAHGGLGLGATAYSRLVQEFSRHDGSVAITLGAHSSIGMRGLIMFGTDDQKKRYLPKLATGEMIAAYCLTEPGSGSDAASIKTKAVRDGDHWILNGQKLWITNGGIADFFTVFALTDTPEGKITAFIVTRDMVGVTNSAHEDKMGLRASSTTTVFFDNVRVPHANVLGELGKGFKVAVKILNNGRTGLGGGCIGGMKKCIQNATKQAKERKQFGRPIAEFGLIKQKIGHMVVETYAAESVVNMVSGLIDQGYKDYAVEAAISKVFASDALWRTVDEALQIAGGNGYMREYPYERLMRDCRINRIFEGTNDILHLFISLTSIQDVGAQLKELARSVSNVTRDPIKGFGLFVDYGMKALAGTTGIGQSRITKAHPALRAYSLQLEEHARELQWAVDRIIRKHQSAIIEKQFALKRLAMIMIDIFAMSCVLSRVSQSIEDRGQEKAQKEIDILEVFAGQVRGRIARAYHKIDRNDDELIKALSDFAVENERYVWDNM
jgi:acyl-CoA dehydrogenase family protein 9